MGDSDECTRLGKENSKLKAEVNLLRGGMNYLEESKVPWLEEQIRKLQGGTHGILQRT
jgi:hypothetical protein